MSVAAFAPSHTIPDGGLEAWDVPDPSLAPSARLDPWLAVQVTGSNGGWTRVQCANGWSAWVDGAALVPARWASAAAGPGPAMPASTAVPAATGPTTWMAIGGSVAVALSAFVPWVSLNLGLLGSVSANAFKVPLEALWNVQTSSIGQSGTSPLTVGLALVAIGVVGLAAVFGPSGVLPLDLARRSAGGLAVFIASDFVRQMSTALGQMNRAGGPTMSVLSVLGFGVYVAIAGGALMLIGTGRRPAAGPA